MVFSETNLLNVFPVSGLAVSSRLDDRISKTDGNFSSSCTSANLISQYTPKMGEIMMRIILCTLPPRLLPEVHPPALKPPTFLDSLGALDLKKMYYLKLPITSIRVFRCK
jgi:hypothetical protein